MLFKGVDVLEEELDEQAFKRIIEANKPIIVKNCPLGECMDKWNLEYLTEKLRGQSVVIHESETNELDFLTKNFKYKTMPFEEFSNQLKSQGSKSLYLRSTNKDPRSKRAARIEEDFPSLEDDLKPPSFIPYKDDSKLYHSSILRVASSNVQIWTHFDLYDNVLVQVVGVKRIILFPPEDIQYLYIKNDKSTIIDLDEWKKSLESYPLLAKTKPYKCSLKAGELLFIPALWWHNIRTESNDASHSIGFNLFWRDSTIEADNKSFYAETDVYGNKNLKPVDSALANLDKAINHIDKLPGKYKLFYKHFLLLALKNKLFPS